MLTDITLGLVIYSMVFYFADAELLGFLAITLVMAILIGSMNDLAYHQGLSALGGLPACSSFDCDWFGQMFLSGANRHAEHHAHPNIPGPRLPGFSREARSVLMANGVTYDRGFVVALLKRLVHSPFFLPKT
ncbi:MAG: fatty acid desaturase [Mesorhizobium sp.]|nr:MAG: fatty acid desaturase [Mesorhizobium sp.]